MANEKIANSLFNAMSILIDKSISKAEFDKTYKAQVTEIVNDSQGWYKVQHENVEYNAYTDATTVHYKIGDSVYILIPSGEPYAISKKIIGLAKGVETGEELETEEDIDYYKVSPFIVNQPSEITLDSGNVDLVGAGADALKSFLSYLQSSDGLYIEGTFETSFTPAISGLARPSNSYEYGIAIEYQQRGHLDTAVTKTISFNSRQMSGTPYSYLSPSTQSIVIDFAQKGINVNDITAINKIYFYSTELDANEGTMSVKATNLKVYCIDYLLLTGGKNIAVIKYNEEDNLEAALLDINGKEITEGVAYEWQVDTFDGTNDFTSIPNAVAKTYSIIADDILAYETLFKCIVTYKEESFEGFALYYKPSDYMKVTLVKEGEKLVCYLTNGADVTNYYFKWYHNKSLNLEGAGENTYDIVDSGDEVDEYLCIVSRSQDSVWQIWDNIGISAENEVFDSITTQYHFWSTDSSAPGQDSEDWTEVSDSLAQLPIEPSKFTWTRLIVKTSQEEKILTPQCTGNTVSVVNLYATSELEKPTIGETEVVIPTGWSESIPEGSEVYVTQGYKVNGGYTLDTGRPWSDVTLAFKDGKDAVTAVSLHLSNDSDLVPATSSGVVDASTALGGAMTTIEAYENGVKVTSLSASNLTCIVKANGSTITSGYTFAINGSSAQFTLTSWTNASTGVSAWNIVIATFTYATTVGEEPVVISRDFVMTKMPTEKGENGDAAVDYSLTTSHNVVNLSISPSGTVTAKVIKTVGSVLDSEFTTGIEYSTDNATWSTGYSYPWDLSSTNVYFRYKVGTINGTSVYETESVEFVKNGDPGYSISLTNDSATIATSEDGSEYSSTALELLSSTAVQVYEGSSLISTGLTYFWTALEGTLGNGATSSSNWLTSIEAEPDKAMMTVSVSLNGALIGSKTFTITKNKQGQQGDAAVNYKLIAPQQVINSDALSSGSTYTYSFNIAKLDGLNTSNLTSLPSGFSLSVSGGVTATPTYNTELGAWTFTYSGSVSSAITIELTQGSVVIDKEVVELVKNGEKGDSIQVESIVTYITTGTIGLPETPPDKGDPESNEWSATKPAVSSSAPFLWSCSTTKTTINGTSITWGDWTNPVLAAAFGSDGSDADVTLVNTFNALTNGGALQGFWYTDDKGVQIPPEEVDENSQMYINASMIRTGVFYIGGSKESSDGATLWASAEKNSVYLAGWTVTPEALEKTADEYSTFLRSPANFGTKVFEVKGPRGGTAWEDNNVYITLVGNVTNVQLQTNMGDSINIPTSGFYQIASDATIFLWEQTDEGINSITCCYRTDGQDYWTSAVEVNNESSLTTLNEGEKIEIIISSFGENVENPDQYGLSESPVYIKADGSFFLTQGQIAHWKINENSLSSDFSSTEGTTTVTLSCPTAIGGYGVGAADVLVVKYNDGKGDQWPFVLSSDGSIRAKKGTIGDFEIKDGILRGTEVEINEGGLSIGSSSTEGRWKMGAAYESTGCLYGIYVDDSPEDSNYKQITYETYLYPHKIFTKKTFKYQDSTTPDKIVDNEIEWIAL